MTDPTWKPVNDIRQLDRKDLGWYKAIPDFSRIYRLTYINTVLQLPPLH